jgi:hypothetical protein
MERTDPSGHRSISNRCSIGDPELEAMENPLMSSEATAPPNAGCVTSDTWVMTSHGARRVHDLVGLPFSAIVDGKGSTSSDAGFYFTGVKPAFDIRTSQGPSVKATADQRLLGIDRFGLTSWKTVAELRPGERLVLHRHDRISWDGPGTYEQGQTLGGYFTTRSHAKVYALLRQAQAIAADRGARVPAGADQLATRYGMDGASRHISGAIEAASSDFVRGFLQSCFDGLGSIAAAPDPTSLRLRTQSASDRQAMQRMLARLGILSAASDEPAAIESTLFVQTSSLGQFAARVGFADPDKARALKTLLPTQDIQRDERPAAELSAVIPIGRVPVFDCEIPGLCAFDANGLYVHNSGPLAAA